MNNFKNIADIVLMWCLSLTAVFGELEGLLPVTEQVLKILALLGSLIYTFIKIKKALSKEKTK
jgi:hypothetical protein